MNRDPLLTLSRTKLLKEKISSLELFFENSIYYKAQALLHFELEHKRLRVRPKIWASDEWFCPDGHTSFAIPFTLLHPRLISLSKEFGLKVEGENFNDFMKLARHECGHVMDNAYGLRTLAGRSEVFGDLQIEYPSEYSIKKHSRKFVRYLPESYAQAHPEEDWAETFAVWLDSNSNWHEKYKNWAALEKLKFMDQKMKSLVDKRCLKNDLVLDHFHQMDLSLNEFFKMKKAQAQTSFKASWLKEYISPTHSGQELSIELQMNRQKLIEEISRTKKLKKYDLNYALSNLELNARVKDLRIKKSKNNFKVLLELTERYSEKFLNEGKHRILM